MADEAERARLLGTFRRPFREQVAAWRLRYENQIGTAAWDDLWQAQHDRAFVVAGAMKADLLADLAGAVDKAITQGTTLDEFRRDFRRIVEARGWHGWTGEGSARGEAWRTRVIYQTNLRTSYAAGRHAQLVAGGYKFWVYRHGGSREPRLNHLSWNGLAVPPDHPFWASHYPPNGWGCSCHVAGARSAAGVRRVGGDPDKPLPDDWQVIDPRTGAPSGIGRGWAYAPGASVAQDVNRIVTEKIATLPPPLASSFAASVQGDESSPRRGPFSARTVSEAAEIAVSQQIAQTTGFVRGMPASGLNTVLTTVAEVNDRFGLAPLDYLGGVRQYPGGPPRGVAEALAFYAPRQNRLAFTREVLNDDRDFGGSRLSDRVITRWMQAIAVAAPEISERAGRISEWRWSPIRSLDMLLIHEMAHRLHSSREDEVNRLLRGSSWFGGWPLLVGRYAQTSPEEFFAESFVIYMRYPDQHFRLAPPLLEFFRSIDRAS